jgi:sulfite reductase (NADPH) flavoprotein alpha-component
MGPLHFASIKNTIGKTMGKLLHTLHLYLGLGAALVLMVVATTGAILSYEKQLLRIIHAKSYTVAPQGQKLSNEALISHFLEKNGEVKINAMTLSTDVNAATIINIASQESRKGENIFLNPYTGEILPKVTSHKFFMFVENLHRRLLLGEVGKQVVGASVLILIFLLLSGVYMYMPKIKRGFINALTINTQAKGRSFLYTLHGSVGLWVLPIYLSITLTGLYWSYHWYNDLLHSLTGVESHKHAPMPKEGMKKGEAKEQRAKMMQKMAMPKAPLNQPQNIATAFDLFHANVTKRYSEVMLRTPRSGDVYMFFYLGKESTHPYAKNKAEINIQTQELLKDEHYEDKKMSEKLMASIFALHSGEFFGWFGQLLFFLSSLMMPLFGITGFMLYLKKRRTKYAH